MVTKTSCVPHGAVFWNVCYDTGLSSRSMNIYGSFWMDCPKPTWRTTLPDTRLPSQAVQEQVRRRPPEFVKIA